MAGTQIEGGSDSAKKQRWRTRREPPPQHQVQPDFPSQRTLHGFARTHAAQLGQAHRRSVHLAQTPRGERATSNSASDRKAEEAGVPTRVRREEPHTEVPAALFLGGEGLKVFPLANSKRCAPPNPWCGRERPPLGQPTSHSMYIGPQNHTPTLLLIIIHNENSSLSPLEP